MRRVAIVWSDQTGQDLGCGRGTANHELGVIRWRGKLLARLVRATHHERTLAGAAVRRTLGPKGGCRKHGTNAHVELAAGRQISSGLPTTACGKVAPNRHDEPKSRSMRPLHGAA